MKRPGCPILATIGALRGKWKVQVLWYLTFGPRGFAELRTMLAPVSEKVLAAQLRELEADGMITRTVLRASPPRVSYALSDAGRSLVPLLQSMCAWGEDHFKIESSLRPPPDARAAPSARRGSRAKDADERLVEER